MISSTSKPTRISPFEISSAEIFAGISTNSRIQDKGARVLEPYSELAGETEVAFDDVVHIGDVVANHKCAF